MMRRAVFFPEQRGGMVLSVWANVLDSVQTLLAIGSTVAWMVGEYYDGNDNRRWVVTQFAFSILYICAWLTQLASSGLVQHRTRLLLFDAVVSLPIFYQAYQLGYYDDDSHGWRKFISALHVPLQWLVVARCMRLVRVFQRTSLRSGALLISSDVVRSVSSLLFTVVCFVVVGGGLLQLIENASVNGAQLSVWDSLYTVFGVITVIGFGTPPATVLGQIVDAVILLLAIIILPVQIGNLVSSVHDHYKLGTAYTKREPHVVMVVYPTMTPSDLNSMLREFYSYHSHLAVYHCVLLGSGGEAHRDTLMSYISTSQYWSSVTYVVGSPSSISSLQKVAVQHASAVFLLTSAWFVDPDQELADDEQSLFQAVTIKQYCPAVPLIISLNKPSSRAHVLWFELCKFPAIHAVCLNETKLQLLATQAMAPGLLGLIANLLQFGGHTGTEPIRSWWQGLLSYQPEAAVWANPLVPGTWPLSATPPAHLADAPIQHSWEVQYLTGFLQELRTCPLPPALLGLCFADVAALLYERLLVVLLAVGRKDARTGRLRAILNPGYGEQLRVGHGDLLCIMVQSAEHARAVSEVQWSREPVRNRWKTQHGQPVPFHNVRFTSLGSPLSPALPRDGAVANHFTHSSTSTAPPQAHFDGSAKAAPGLSLHVDLPVDNAPNGRAHIVELAPTRGEEMKISHETIVPMTRTAGPVAHKQHTSPSADQFSGHVVLCGFIDSRVVSFVRRFRASDSRTLVLMLDNALCYPLPAVVEHFIATHFRDVHILYAASSYKARHQRARMHLSYSAPCHGHHHYRAKPQAAQRRERPSDSALASCVSSRGGSVESEREALMRPVLPIDEVGPLDRQILRGLEQLHPDTTSVEQAEYTLPPLESELPRRCRVDEDSDEAGELDAQAALQYASWYRRACVHSADMVLVLSSAYTAPPDSTSSNGGTALNDDTSLNRDQLYITSLFQYAQRATNTAVKDDQIRADQHALIMHAGIQTYLWQCSVSGCPSLRARSPPPPVVVELLYQINVRLLKQGTTGINRWQPHMPQPKGWRWLLQACHPTQHTHARISDAESEEWEAGGGEEAAGSLEPANTTGDRRRALYTSDGLSMSSRLLDSLIVQAYVDPLVYHTVHTLGTTYTHRIPTRDWQHINSARGRSGGPADSSGVEGDEAVRRSFRVELMLLDVPAELAGRSFGFLQLLIMVEYGWVALGLYRDKRTLASGVAESASGVNPTSIEQSPYFVFTNPPPDVCLERSDRIYALVQRWLDVNTAESMAGEVASGQEWAAGGVDSARQQQSESPELDVPSIPESYSPRGSTFRRRTPAMAD